jgi:hypothetical protein
VPISFDTLPESFDVPEEAPAALRMGMTRQGIPDGQVTILRIGEQLIFIKAP